MAPGPYRRSAPPAALGEAIRRAFDAHFAGLGRHAMTLPAEALARPSGGFQVNGWDVAYRFGADFLDCWASHRMTNDRLYRVHADGRVELLDSTTDGMVPDADRDFRARLRRHGLA